MSSSAPPATSRTPASTPWPRSPVCGWAEIRALRWRDIEFANHTIHVRASYTHNRLGPPKSGKVPAVPLIDIAARRLDQLSRREHFTDPQDLVFCTPTGRYLNEGQLLRRFYTALEEAGLGHKRESDKPIVFHDLRHTFGTLAVKAWDLPKVQGYMGHADITTTTLRPPRAEGERRGRPE